MLLPDGWAGLCDDLGRTPASDNGSDGRAGLDELTSYFVAHSGRLNYCHRLYTGQSIGSGMVEGAAKNPVGRGLNQTGARWQVENVNKLAELCCLPYGDHREPYWACSN
jgi:hypothetical protein